MKVKKIRLNRLQNDRPICTRKSPECLSGVERKGKEKLMKQVKVNHEHYTYRVTWSQEDGEFVGLCAELPGLSYLDESYIAAMKGIVNLVGDVLEDMEASGEAIPEPLAYKKYSGKFVVRIPPDQHRSLVMKAAESGVSLNRYISSRLCG